MELSQSYRATNQPVYYLFNEVSKKQLKPLMKGASKAAQNLVINLSQVEQIDLKGIRSLIKLQDMYRKRNLTISLSDVPAVIQTYLEMTQVDQLFGHGFKQTAELPFSA